MSQVASPRADNFCGYNQYVLQRDGKLDRIHNRIYRAVSRRGLSQNDVALVRLALAFMSIVVIQLFEALLYRYCRNSDTSKIWRSMILIAICMQPILLFLGARQYEARNFDPHLTRACEIMVLVYVIMLLVDPPSIEESEGCGKWVFGHFNVATGILYHVLLLSSILIPKNGGRALFGVGLLTFVAALFMGENQPSKWCILAALTPWCLLFMNDRGQEMRRDAFF